MQTKSVFALSVATYIVLGCTAPQKGFEVSSDTTIQDKAVVLSYEEVNSYLPEEVGDNYIIVVDANGKNLPAQFDDLDKDGNWDEMAFLVNLEAGVPQTVYFNAVSEDELPDFPKRTNVRFGYVEEPYAEVSAEDRLKTTDSPTISGVFQMEGPAWENELVGFRNYYDARNGIDIFGKATTGMVLDSAGIRGQNYHELDDWGMDILKVGNSLGAGALGIRVNGEVVRVGQCEKGTYEFITEGPVRAILKLNYFGMAVNDRIYDIEHEISIYAGDRFYRSKVSVDGLQGDEQLVTGIVNMEQKEAFTMEENGFRIVASHGNQAYLGEVLGMAVLVPDDEFIETWTAPDEGSGIVETHMVAIDLEEGEPSEYYFFSGWEYQDEGFKTQDYFKQQLAEASAKLAN
ncbi:DUF4861 family protein [Marinilabilia sp.]|uniref:DUF4861 family protein n=1 Tax=Marinilabilia sp. TaxID=2021252 RepID=UPI0025BBB366|nr:DUF4861 family protein [Marinilabilia sp.]